VPSDEELVAIKERAVERLMRLPGVHAVGIGGRDRDGRPTGEIVLKVFVYEKRPAGELAPGELVPAEVEGVLTDVVAMGDAELAATPEPGEPEVPVSALDGARQRPLVGGCQLQVDLTASLLGTLGCFMVDTTDPAKVYAPTNQHILSTKKLQPTVGATKAGQPTPKDSSTRCCSHVIGTVAGGGKDPAALPRDPSESTRFRSGALSG
jgi:hypothetical protein